MKTYNELKAKLAELEYTGTWKNEKLGTNH
jgi:hypothetical protein